MDSNAIGLPAVIIGPKGLRAGWRLLIFLLMLVAMGAVARAIITRFLIPAGFSPDKFTPLKVAVPDAFFVFIVAVAAWVMSKIEGRKVGQYGLPVKQGLMKHLGLGLGIGFLASSARANHLFAAWASDREPDNSWHDDSDVGGCLGRRVPVISHSGGVPVSRICAVHPDNGHRLLAGSSGTLRSLRIRSPEQ